MLMVVLVTLKVDMSVAKSLEAVTSLRYLAANACPTRRTSFHSHHTYQLHKPNDLNSSVCTDRAVTHQASATTQ